MSRIACASDDQPAVKHVEVFQMSGVGANCEEPDYHDMVAAPFSPP